MRHPRGRRPPAATTPAHDPRIVALMLMLGFGFFKAASSVGYLSAMGTAPTNLGFVSQLPFMMFNCLVKTLVALVILLLAMRGRLGPGRLGPGRLGPGVGYSLLVLVSAAGAAVCLMPEGGPLSDALSSVFLGVAKGAGTAAASIFWLERLVFLTPRSCVGIILGSYVVQGVLGLGLAAIPSGLAAQLAMLAIYAGTYACARVLFAEPPALDPTDHTGRVDFGSEDGRSLASAWLCIIVAQFVVGIANTAVFASSFSSIMAAVDVNVCVIAATAVLAALLALTRRVPEPEATFKVAMPLLLGVFTLTALAADQFGVAFGYAMIGCYEAIAVAYTVYLVRYMQQHPCNPFYLLGLTTSVINAALLAGLGIGVALNAVCDERGVPIFTLLAFVAIYPFGIALLFIQRNRARNEASEARRQALSEAATQAGAAAGQGSPTAGETVTRTEVEDYHSSHVAAFAAARGLTRRETEVCLHLTRGRTVKGISDALGISENTVWTHVRNVYAKCGVGTKQELIELFETFDGKRE